MSESPFRQAVLADIPAFRCAHASDELAGTGCTVAVSPAGAVCGVDVRGGGPATRETDLLRPENMIEKIHAVMLSGGSAFGLQAAGGAMDALAQRGIGFMLGDICVPIVVSACLFDLAVGSPQAPYYDLGKHAAEAALDASGAPSLAEGNVGAGCGATVGKMLLPKQAMKSGFGVYGLRMGDLVTVALVAVNALGQVRDESGAWIAGARGEDGRVLSPLEVYTAREEIAKREAQALKDAQSARTRESEKGKARASDTGAAPCTNTTLGLILTNADITKAQATKVSSTTHDAFARAIEPVHSMNDGDTVFTLASGEIAAQTDSVAILASESMRRAIVRACTEANAAWGLPSASLPSPQPFEAPIPQPFEAPIPQPFDSFERRA